MNDDRNPQSPPPSTATPKSAAGMSRREFTLRAALAGAAATLAAGAASVAGAGSGEAAARNATPAVPVSQDPRPTAGAAGTPPAAAATAAELPKLSTQSQAEADARVQSILGQYGDRLSDEQKTDIRRLCAFAQPPLDRLRTYHLENADGEALYLKPLVEREKKPPTPATTQKPAAKPAAKKQ